MHSVSVEAVNKVQQSVDVNARARVVAEWNHNRFAQIQSVTNGSSPESEEYDNDIFPVSSIVEPERPTRGIVKAFAGGSTGGPTSLGYADTPDSARVFTHSMDSKYKYWVSPSISASASPFAIANVLPQVIYSSSVYANKIVVTFENSFVSPSAFTIQITDDGTNWTTVSTTPAIQPNGRVEIYRQNDGSWSNVININNPTNIRGVRTEVTNLSSGNARISLIEIGLRIQSDISQYVISYGTDITMSEVSFLTPIGRASSNEASVKIDNTSGVFTNENASSPYYKLIDKNVGVQIQIAINKGTLASPDYEWITQFTGRTDSWPGQARTSGTEMVISDDSQYIQSIYPNPMLFTDVTAAEAIWRIIDSVGFSNWAYTPSSSDPTMQIPAFWCDGSKTVWEVIAEVAEVTQTAVFFDEYGIIKIVPRSMAYNLSNSSVWQIDGVVNGAKIPDVIEAEVVRDFEANVVEIEYTPTAISETTSSGIRPMEVVWEPENTVTIRSTQLVKNMTATDTSFYVTQSEAKLWPYTSVVQVEGEFIRYTAKEYSYYLANGTVAKEFIDSDEKKVALDKLNPSKSYLNNFTGRFQTSISNRGLWSTEARLHDINYSNWTSKRFRTSTGPIKNWSGGFLPNYNDSTIRIKTNSTFSPNTWYTATIGSSSDVNQPIFYGTRIQFDSSGYTFGAAGIAIGVGTNDSGYFIEVMKTSIINTAARSKYNHEIWVCYKNSSGSITRIGRGAQVAISPGIWYDIDVRLVHTNASSRTFYILLNGVPVLTAVHNAAIPADNKGARCGLFTRGNTSCQFEYFYNSREADNPSFDHASWWDRIKGGYQSNQFDGEWGYGRYNTVIIRGRVSITRPVRTSKRYMDEFGPIVHEVREYDVKFEKSPVLHSNIYFSNESQAICPEYNANAFGAKFVMANFSRSNAVLKGEDTTTFGIDNPVEQKFIIYGRNYVEQDARKHVVEDAQAVRKRGKIVTQIASKWIQNEAAAKKLGEWIVSHWSGGADEVRVTSFGNPFIQLTDVVSINRPSHNMLPATHKYFVVGISQNYENGLQTTFVIRRMKI